MCSRLVFNVLSILCICGLALTFTSDELRITLSNGSKLIGRYYRSYSGRPIKAFMSIPFAAPPVGHLRFKNPEPKGKWDGEYKAVNDVPSCPQQNPIIRKFDNVGDEDCLYLNVYVPHAFDGPLSNLPVLVAFPGGGFVCFSSSKTLHGPDNFLDQDVILVVANYRVGTLGFLSTLDENCSGNFGLKDNVMALKWIQENIKQFGGDPGSVTIIGASSAGSNVAYLMTSPLAEGLFSKAITLSGTNLASWAQPAFEGVAQKRATQLAKRVNCFVPNDWLQTIECLRTIPTYKISAVAFELYDFDREPKLIFSPVLEPDLPGAFLTEDPRDIMKKSVSKVPFVTGINFNEALKKSLPLLQIPGLYDEFADNLNYILSVTFYYNHFDPSVQEAITKKFNEFYFDNNLTREKEKNLTDLFGDAWYLAPTDEFLRLRLGHEEAPPTFVYLFTPKITVSRTEYFSNDPHTFYGVCHGDELQYLYPIRERQFISSLPTKEDEQVREAMIRIVTDFARTGNPTPESSPQPKCEAVKGFPVNYYRIGDLDFEDKPIFGMETGGFFEERAKFWRELATFTAAKLHSRDEL